MSLLSRITVIVIFVIAAFAPPDRQMGILIFGMLVEISNELEAIRNKLKP